MEMPEKESDIAETAKGILETILDLLEISASVAASVEPPVEGEEGATASIALEIEGEDLGILIGRRGETLSCLQHLVKLIVGHQTKAWLPMVIDVEGYKRRRHESLRALAQRMAERVKDNRVPFALEPMSAFERRIIHLALADHPDVTTESSGEGEVRKVVILPK